mgnify:CR=1 FL=1
MQYVILLDWRTEATSDERDGALIRRAEWSYPDGLNVIAESWTAGSSPAVVVIAGVVAGCWFGWSVWSVLPTILRGAATWDSAAIGGAALPLTLATFAGALLPAWRALRRDPAYLIGSSG